MLLPRGKRLTDRDVMLAAAMSHPTVPVHRRPKVAVLGTGDELKAPGAALGPGRDRLFQRLCADGAGARRRRRGHRSRHRAGPGRGDRRRRSARARDAGADVLLTTGGASVGDYDLVQRGLKAEGLELSFWRVALRPGRPMMNGRLGAMHVLGLPGNPVSAYVCAFLFLVPLHSQACRAERHRAAARIGGAGLATCRKTTSAPIICAPRSSAGPNGTLVATPVSDPGLVDDGGARKGRLSRRSRGLRARGARPASVV